MILASEALAALERTQADLDQAQAECATLRLQLATARSDAVRRLSELRALLPQVAEGGPAMLEEAMRLCDTTTAGPQAQG